MKERDLTQKIVQWLKEYAKKSGAQCFVIGVSGGIDWAVTSNLCALTGLPVIALNLPLNSKTKNTDLSNTQLEWLSSKYENVTTDVITLDHVYCEFEKKMLNYSNSLGFANSKSRLRMVTLYQVSASKNGLVVGTGNKVEDFGVGFYTKYGDGGVDISPIADLTKTQVRKLAKDMGIHSDIINAPPTDGLWEDSRTDEQQIGASYEELEWAMTYKESNIKEKLSDRQKKVLSIYEKFNNANKHKMVDIPVYKLGE